MTKFIHIDYRTGRTKAERAIYGQVQAEKTTADMFINLNKNRHGNDLIDTFFHEMTHVFLAFHGKSRQMTDAQEERLAQQIGRACSGILR